MYTFSSAVICSLNLKIIYFFSYHVWLYHFAFFYLVKLAPTSFPIILLEMWSQLAVIRL